MVVDADPGKRTVGKLQKDEKENQRKPSVRCERRRDFPRQGERKRQQGRRKRLEKDCKERALWYEG